MRPQDHGAPLWPTRDGCLSPLHHTLNHLFCGAWLPGLDRDPAAPPTRLKSCFVRIGNSCSEEARVLELLKSHKDAWIDWLAAMKVALLAHYARLDGAERATPCLIDLSRTRFSSLPCAPNYRSTVAICVCPAP